MSVDEPIDRPEVLRTIGCCLAAACWTTATMIAGFVFAIAQKAGWRVDLSYLLYSGVALPACLGAIVAGLGFIKVGDRRRRLLRIAAGLLSLSVAIFVAMMVAGTLAERTG